MTATTPNPAPAYGPCTPAVLAVLGRASGLSALEIIGLAHARDQHVENDTWNAAIDALNAVVDATGRRPNIAAASEEAMRMTWLAATTASTLSAAMGDRLAPSVSGILTAPWRAVTDTSAPATGALS